MSCSRFFSNPTSIVDAIQQYANIHLGNVCVEGFSRTFPMPIIINDQIARRSKTAKRFRPSSRILSID